MELHVYLCQFSTSPLKLALLTDFNPLVTATCFFLVSVSLSELVRISRPRYSWKDLSVLTFFTILTP